MFHSWEGFLDLTIIVEEFHLAERSTTITL